MIGIVIGGCSELKFLYPIILNLQDRKVDFILYNNDEYRGHKEYDRSKLSNLIYYAPGIGNVSKVRPFTNSKEDLLRLIKEDNIKKLIIIEATLTIPELLCELHDTFNIEVYSVNYFVDSMLKIDFHLNGFIKAKYHMAERIAEEHVKYNNIEIDPNIDKFIGSPAYDPIDPEASGKHMLMLLPNIRHNTSDRVGGEKIFRSIVEKFIHPDMIFKSRKKHWTPPRVQKTIKSRLGKDICYDHTPMYPPVISKLLNGSHLSVIFRSSAIYECVYAGNYVINVEMDVTPYAKDTRLQLRSYLNSDIYNFDGVVESWSMTEVIKKDWKFSPKKINEDRRKEWIEKNIGKCAQPNGVANIVDDILGE